MLSGIQKLFGKTNNNSPSPTESEVSVRSPEGIKDLESMIKGGPVTFVLVHADWCGPCQGYKPVWKELEQSPGRKANMAMIHHDMVEKSPSLRNAKIPGYPSVLKVYQNGHIEEYKGDSEKTNAMPSIRDKGLMSKELKSVNLNKFLLTNNPKTIAPKGSFMRPITNSLPSLAPRSSATPRSSVPTSLVPRSSVPTSFIPRSSVPPSFIPRSSVPPSFIPRSSASSRPMPRANMTKRVSLFNKNPIRNMKRPLVYKKLNKQYPASELTRRNLTNSAVSADTIRIGASVPPMKGGLYRALSQALLRAGPASLLFAASQMLPPKKQRGSTMRLTRKANRKTRKN